MKSRRLKGISCALAMECGCLGIWGCGSRTDVGLVDGVASPAEDHDATTSCAGPACCDGPCVQSNPHDANVDVSFDLDTNAPSIEAAPDSAGDVVVADVARDAPLGPDAGDDGSPPSCTPGGTGMTNCGDGGESCCTSLEVEGGTYYRTYTNEGTGPAGEADPATVSGFRLDKYLVTVGRFRQFVRAWDEGAGYLPPAGSGKHTHLNAGLGLLNVGQDAGVAYETGWLASDDDNIAPTDDNLTASCLSDPSYATWTPSPGEQENLPINCVNWWESYAFCIWDGGFLPSESEWEYAAAGGSQQREYPWGAADPGTNSRYAIYGDYYEKDGAAFIAPVGIASLGAGYWGQLDMAGEIFESSLDWFAGDYVNPCVDCAYLVEGSNPARVERGADFVLGPLYLTPTFRSSSVPTRRGEAGGVRCARTP